MPLQLQGPESKKKLGRFVGIAENVGDTLTYKILTDDTEQVICRSVVRSAECSPDLRNYRVDPPPEIVESVSIHQDMKELPTIDPEQLLGFRYVQHRDDGDYKAKVVR